MNKENRVACLLLTKEIHNFKHRTMDENVYLTGIDNNYPTNHQPMYNHRIFNHTLFDFIMRWHFSPSLSSFPLSIFCAHSFFGFYSSWLNRASFTKMNFLHWTFQHFHFCLIDAQNTHYIQIYDYFKVFFFLLRIFDFLLFRWQHSYIAMIHAKNN